MSSVRFFKNLAWSRGLRVKFSKSKAPDQGWLRKSTKFGTLKKSGSARSKSLIFYRRFPLDVESDSRVSKVGAWSPFQSEIKSYKVPPICGHRCALWAPSCGFRQFRTLGSTFGLQNRSQRVERPRNRGVEGSLALRAWISCVRARFAAILVEKTHIFGIKNYRHSCRQVSGHFWSLLGAHNCFDRICARPAVAS